MYYNKLTLEIKGQSMKEKNILSGEIMLKPAAILLIVIFSSFLFYGINQALAEKVQANSRAIEKLMAEAESHLQDASYDEAIAIYEDAIAIGPDNILAHQGAGKAYSLSEQLEEAEAEFKKVLKIDPNYVPALNNLADVYLRTGRPEEALELINKAIEIEPQFSVLYQTCGEIYEAMDKYDLAIKMYGRATHDPRFKKAANEAIRRLKELMKEKGG